MTNPKINYNPENLELRIKKFSTFHETPKLRYRVELYYPVEGKRRCITKQFFEEDNLRLQHIKWLRECGEYYLQDCLTWSARWFLNKAVV